MGFDGDKGMKKKYLVGLNFQEYVEADNEEEAKEKFSEMYEVRYKYLFADEIESNEETEE